MASGRPLQKYLAKKTYNLLPWENQKMENICRNERWTWWAVEKVEPRWWERFGCFVLCLMTIGEILVTIWLLGLYAFWLQTSHDFGDSTLSCYYCREKNPDLFEKMQRTETSDAPEPGISIFFIFVFVFALYFVFLTLSGVNDDIIIRLGPKCDSARSAVSAECFRFFLSVKILLPLKSWLWFFSCGWVCM